MEYDMAEGANKVQRACSKRMSLGYSIFILGLQHEPTVEHGISEPKHAGPSHPAETVPNHCLLRSVLQEDCERELASNDIYGKSSNSTIE